MKKDNRALLNTGCVVAFAIMLACFATGTAFAAIVPFNGTDYSWLHANEKGDPEGYWITQIKDTISVRDGDMMQFRNRWYNSYAGTADVRISYGGGQPYTCIGSDEYASYGLNFGNYYPSGTESISYYAQVVASQGGPDSLEEYSFTANHQYVYNGVIYGCAEVSDQWDMKFRCTGQHDNGTDLEEAPGSQNYTQATAMPTAMATPRLPGPTPAAPAGTDTSTPLPASELLAMTVCALTIVYIMSYYLKERQK